MSIRVGCIQPALIHMALLVIFLINYVEKRQHDRLGGMDNIFLHRSLENYQV